MKIAAELHRDPRENHYQRYAAMDLFVECTTTEVRTKVQDIFQKKDLLETQTTVLAELEQLRRL